MNTFFRYKRLIFILVIFFFSFSSMAQLSAPADSFLETSYSGTSKQDKIFIFCTVKDQLKASLTVSTALTGTLTYEWQKYNSATGSFLVYAGGQSTISSLENGGYRVIINNGTSTETYTAWVFNNYYEITTTSVTESNCKSFKLNGAYDSPKLIYYDLGNNQPKEINRNINVQWKEGGSKISSLATTTIYTPPTIDTRYAFSITDDFGCGSESETTYVSIVTKAKFTVSKEEGEAPLEVAFKNESENGTTGRYEWFFFRDLEDIKREAADTKQPVDSIDFKAYDDQLTYTYENSGTYMVKLVSKKISAFSCTDTFYLEKYIVADTSFVKAPNFFTPNGDGSNDKFVVKFWSVKQIKISIFNRWGKQVHMWESSDVRGFENTVSKITESVWDGRIGDRMASPGVYYYVVEARGVMI